MGGTFIVTLREGFEAALLLGIVYTYLHQVGASRHARFVTRGALLGGLASVALGVGVSLVSGPLLDLGPDLIAAVVMFVAVAVLTWHGWWMRQQARGIPDDLQKRIDAAEASHPLWGLGLIAFTAVFREGAETVLFVWGLMTQAATGSAWAGLSGAVLGIFAAAGLGWALFRGALHLSVRRFFGVTSVLLLFVAAGLFSGGIGRLQGLGLLPAGEVLWDTSWLVDDESLTGSFLNGLIGYRAKPSTLEAVGYGVYLVIAGALLYGDALRTHVGRSRLAPPARRSPQASARKV
jgi:high-affinity iron transporter